MNKFSLGLILFSAGLCCGISLAQSQTPADPNKTQVVILGTIHDAHYKNPKYSPDVLKDIVLSLKPAVILNELPLSLVDPNGRPIEKFRQKDMTHIAGAGPECWAADTAAQQLGIKQIPFDRPDRQKNFKKTRYFEREKSSQELLAKWGHQIEKSDANSVDIKIARLTDYESQAEENLFFNSAADIINSETHDSIIRMKLSLLYDIIPAILKKYPGYESLIDDCLFLGDQWRERNNIMAENIKKAAKEYTGRRLVVVTGATHRYILRDLLKNDKSIELKEYWEITFPKTPSQDANQPTYLKVIPPEKLKEDLDFLFKSIEEIHPNMYAYISREEFAKHRDELYKKINHPASQIEFYKLLAPVIALLRDGHTNVDISHPPSIQDKFFPLGCEWDGENLIISKNFGETNVPIGAAIKTINGEDAGHLIKRLSYCLSSEREFRSQFKAAKELSFFLLLENEPAEYYKLQIRLSDGQIKEYDVKTQTSEKLQEKPDAKPNYSYRHLPEYNALVLTVNTLDPDLGKDFKGFLERTFKGIKDLKTSYLIIDIRENGGGDSRLGDVLLDYLTDKPFHQFDGGKEKVSAQAGNLEQLRKMLPQEKIEIGSVINHNYSFTNPKENPLRFKGKKFVLIGTKTFSSASSFASAVKCFNIATLIGQETGGVTASYGNNYSFRLPNSDLLANISYKYFVQACGKPDGRGVIPDYEVKQKPEDTAKGVDTVLQFTLNLIKDSNCVGPAKQKAN